MTTIVAQGSKKCKPHLGVQLRLFEHSRYAGLSAFFETWRWWNGNSLFEGVPSKRGKDAEQLALTYMCRGPVGAFTQTGIVESIENDDLFERYVPEKVKQYDLSRFLSWFGAHAPTFRLLVIAKLQDTAITKGKPSGVLIVDDTILEKTGKKFSGLRKLYDHAKKKYVKGLSLVQLLYADDQKRYPLFEAIHGTRGRKPCPKRNRETSIGKHKIALRLIKQAVACGIRPKAVLFDAWYAATSFLKALRWLKLQFVCRYNGGWGLLINGRRIKANELTKQKRRYHYYRRLKANAFCLTAELPYYGPVFVVVVKDRRRKPAVIITSIMDADLVAIIELYRKRWTIETYFKEAKQRFGLDKFQHRSAAAIQAHLVLVSLSYILVMLLKLVVPLLQGQSFKYLAKYLFRITAIIVYENATFQIITKHCQRIFQKIVLFFNDLDPLPSTA